MMAINPHLEEGSRKVVTACAEREQGWEGAEATWAAGEEVQRLARECSASVPPGSQHHFPSDKPSACAFPAASGEQSSGSAVRSWLCSPARLCSGSELCSLGSGVPAVQTHSPPAHAPLLRGGRLQAQSTISISLPLGIRVYQFSFLFP